MKIRFPTERSEAVERLHLLEVENTQITEMAAMSGYD